MKTLLPPLLALSLCLCLMAGRVAAQDFVLSEPASADDVPVVERAVVDPALANAPEIEPPIPVSPRMLAQNQVPIPEPPPDLQQQPDPEPATDLQSQPVTDPQSDPVSDPVANPATEPVQDPVQDTLPAAVPPVIAPVPRQLPLPGATNRFNLPRSGGGRPVGPNLPPFRPAPQGGAAAVPTSGATTNATIVTSRGDGDDSTDVINFKNMPLEQFLDEYATISRRTVLRASNLPATAQINFKPASPLTPEERLQMYDTILALNGITMIPTGEKAVLAVPTAQAMQEGAAFANKKVEDYAEASQFVTHVVRVQHIEVQEAAETLKQFAKNQNGIVALETTKTLVLRDYAINIKRMLEVLERIDIEVEQEYQLEVFPVKFGKVEDLYQTLSSVIGGGGGGAMPAANRTGATGRNSGLGGTGLNSGLGNSRLSSGSTLGNRNTSSYNYYGQSEDLELLVPQQATVPRPATSTTGSTFQSRLNAVNRAGSQQNPAQPLLNEASITPDPRSNSLIVYASKKDMAQLRKIIEKVDTLLAQVLIEGVIMEVALTSGLSYGVSAQQRYRQFNSTLGGGGAMDNLSAFSSLTNVFQGIPNGAGLNYLLRFNDDIDVVVQALASDANVNILQRPRIFASHATPAGFFAGQTVPFVSGGYNNGVGLVGSSTFYDRQKVGVGLDVLPYITPDGLVVMEVTQTIEEIAPNNGGIATVANAPVTNTRTANSTISIPSGESVLLGGYIRASKSNGNSGVPLLKDIPLLGNLFRSTSVDKARTELMILMRPTVLPTTQSAVEITRQYQEDSPQIRMMEADFVKEREKLNRKAQRKLDSLGRPIGSPASSPADSSVFGQPTTE
ncbi:MAG: hypothetical protein KIT22_13555 [Verrucomicrobiae bacterium]|nr:hypothetical protein [Verrucomicrobiae bacterium]